MKNFSNFRSRKWTSFRRNRRILAEKALIHKLKNRAVTITLVIMLILVVVSTLGNQPMMDLLSSLFGGNGTPVFLGAKGQDYSLCHGSDPQCSKYELSLLPKSDYTYCYDAPSFTSGSVCDSAHSPEITIAVLSGAANFERRKAIRRTWASVLYSAQNPSDLPFASRSNFKSHFKIVFFVCVPIYFQLGGEERKNLALESKQYEDMVLIEMTETLFSGSRLIAFVYDFVTNCGPLNQSKYLLKVNDDAFVNLAAVSRIANYLSTSRISNLFILGNPVELEQVIRVERQHRYVPETVFRAESYPKYIQGEGYLLSIDAVKKLFAVAHCVRLLYIDDVMMNGLLLNYPIDVVLNSHQWFVSFRPDVKALHIYQTLAVAFGMKTADLDELWQNMNATERQWT